MRQAHALGLRTTATMVFGFGEEPRHIVDHLERLRALQDQTAGFTAFICWPFQAEGTRLKLHDDTTAMRYLRMFALARLYLDNFPPAGLVADDGPRGRPGRRCASAATTSARP